MPNHSTHTFKPATLSTRIAPLKNDPALDPRGQLRFIHEKDDFSAEFYEKQQPEVETDMSTLIQELSPLAPLQTQSQTAAQI